MLVFLCEQNSVSVLEERESGKTLLTILASRLGRNCTKVEIESSFQPH